VKTSIYEKNHFFKHDISLIIASCTQEKKSPIEGACQMIYADWPGADVTFPAQIEGSQFKICSAGYVSFVGNFKQDTIVVDNYGLGKYTCEEKTLEEKFIYFVDKSSIGKPVRLLIDIHNDTLVQKWPADENWKLAEEYSA
jgi:hypothetical protein